MLFALSKSWQNSCYWFNVFNYKNETKITHLWWNTLFKRTNL